MCLSRYCTSVVLYTQVSGPPIRGLDFRLGKKKIGKVFSFKLVVIGIEFVEIEIF